MIEVTVFWWQLPALISVLSILWLFFFHEEGTGFMYGMDTLVQVVGTIGVNLLMWLAVLIWRINAV